MEPTYVPIENNIHLARHIDSMGVVNTDKQAQKQYRIQRDRALRFQNTVIEMKKEIAQLREMVQRFAI